MDCTVFIFLGGCRRATRELASERDGTADLALRLPFVPCFTRSAKLVPRKRRATSQCAFFQSSQRCGLSVKFWRQVDSVDGQGACKCFCSGSSCCRLDPVIQVAFLDISPLILYGWKQQIRITMWRSIFHGVNSTLWGVSWVECLFLGSSSLIGLGGINALFLFRHLCRSRCRNQPHLLPRHLHKLLRLQPLQNLHLQQAGNLM